MSSNYQQVAIDTVSAHAQRIRQASALPALIEACKAVAGVYQDAEDMPIYARKCIAALAKAGVRT